MNSKLYKFLLGGGKSSALFTSLISLILTIPLTQNSFAQDATNDYFDLSNIPSTQLQNEALSWLSGNVTIVHEDGTTDAVPLAECEVSGYDPSKLGEQEISFRFTNSITIKEKALKINSGELGEYGWNKIMYYDLPTSLTTGNSYTIKVRVYSDNEGEISLCPSDIEFNSSQLLDAYTMSVGWNEMEWTFEAESPHARLCFNIGKTSGTLYFDDISLVESGSDVNLVANGTFDDENIDEWSICPVGDCSFEHCSNPVVKHTTFGKKTITVTENPKKFYGTFDEATGTATFGFGAMPEGAVEVNQVRTTPIVAELVGQSDNFYPDVKKIVFDKSIANFRPSTMAYWFKTCREVEEFVGMNYLNTEYVTDMSFMFSGYWANNYITTLDLSSFNIKNVKVMSDMFAWGGVIETIYVGDNWVINEGTDVTDIFSPHYSGYHLVGGKGTRYGYDIQDPQMLNDIINYLHIDGGSENPGLFTKAYEKKNVTLEIVLPKTTFTLGEKLSGYLTVKFDEQLESYEAPWPIFNNMVEECYDPYKLGKQTLTVEYQDATTSVDITVTDDDDAYSILDENTGELTLYYGAYQPGSVHITKMIDNCNATQKVKIDKSFQKYKPTSCSSWFSSYKNLTEITGMENLNTWDVTDMSDMFNGCSSLTSLDLSNFNTEKVKDMSYMFDGCGNLKTIYVGNQWTTNNVEYTEYMFDGCTSLIGGKGTICEAEHYPQTDTYYLQFARIDDPANDAPGYFTMKNGIFVDDETPGEIVADIYGIGETVTVEQETEVDKVVVHREFKKDKPSTIVLPIDMEVGEDMNGYKFYEFAGVAQNSEGKWIASYQQVDKISANTPYIVETTVSAGDGGCELIFDGGKDKILLQTLDEGETTVSTGTGGAEGWEFVGALERKTWENDSPNEFGFAGRDVEEDGISAGDFVRIGAGASVSPTHSYLRYTGDDDPFISKSGEVLPHEIEVHLIPLGSVVKPEEPEDPVDNPTEDPDGDIKTPVSENVAVNSGVNVWSYDKTIVIAAKPGVEYQIFDVNGRLLKTSVTKSDRDEVTLARTGSGIAIVKISGKTFKVAY